MALLAALMVYVFAPWVGRWAPGLGIARYAVALVFPAVLVLSVLVHEFGHVAAGRALGMPAKRITIDLLGGATEFDRDPRTPGGEALLAAGGPAASVLVAGLAALAEDLVPLTGLAEVLTHVFAVLNVALALFNLLPGLPLDGGHLLRAGAWRVFGDRRRATRIAGWFGRLLAVLIVVVPLVRLLGGASTGIMFAAVFVFAGVMIWAGASEALSEAVLPVPDAGSLCRPVLPVAEHLSVAESLMVAEQYGVRELVVLDVEDRAWGVVSRSALLAVPPAQRPAVPVVAVARTVGEDAIVPAGLRGRELAERVRSGAELVVVDRAGVPKGLLAEGDLDPRAARS
ncbi:hypothetical protein GCM10027360_33620 [Amycolatopsis echigonensis]